MDGIEEDKAAKVQKADQVYDSFILGVFYDLRRKKMTC
jgi:hypothetical protein